MNNAPISFAVRAERVDLILARIRSGLDINEMDGNGDVALNIAIIKENIEIIQLLLAHGANPQIKDSQNRDAYQYAIGKAKITAMLRGESYHEIRDEDDDLEQCFVNASGIHGGNVTLDRGRGVINGFGSIFKEFRFEGMGNTESCVFRSRIYAEYICLNDKSIDRDIVEKYNRSILVDLNRGSESGDKPKITSVYDLNLAPALFLLDDNRFSFTIVNEIDGEHDLHVALGYHVLVKNVWIE